MKKAKSERQRPVFAFAITVFLVSEAELEPAQSPIRPYKFVSQWDACSGGKLPGFFQKAHGLIYFMLAKKTPVINQYCCGPLFKPF